MLCASPSPRRYVPIRSATRIYDPSTQNTSTHPAPKPTQPTTTAGVKRAHLLDARIDGGLLLELYSRDGVGTMISADFYEGVHPITGRIRTSEEQDKEPKLARVL